MRVIDCEGSPREMGRQYGEQARDLMHASQVGFKMTDLGPLPDESRRKIRQVWDAWAPDVWEELEGFAEAANVAMDVLIRMNHWKVFGDEQTVGCTSMAICDSPDGPVLGKNNDGGLESPPFIIRRSKPERGLPMIQVTYAGWLSGLDAMNAAGLVNSHNSVGSTHDRPTLPVDIRIWVYRLMRECQTTEQFIDRIAAAPLTGKGFNIVVADQAGDTAVLEAAVPTVAVRDRGQPFVYATNHFITPALAQSDRRKRDQKEISTYRLGYLRWVDQTRPPASAVDIEAILRSKEPWAPCRHGGPHCSHTLWSIVGLPRQGELRIAPGSPDQHAYDVYKP